MNVGTVNTRKQHSMATVLYKFVVKIQQFRRQIRVFFSNFGNSSHSLIDRMVFMTFTVRETLL